MSNESKNTTTAAAPGRNQSKEPKPGSKDDLQAKLAAAEAELAALKAEKAAQTNEQGGIATNEPKEAPVQKVKVYIPRGASNDEPNLFVSVNGVNYLLPKGQESEVPAHIADEIMRSNKAAQVRDMKKDQMIGAGQQGQ